MPVLLLTLMLALAFAPGLSTHADAQSLPGQGQTIVLGYGMWLPDNAITHLMKVLLEDELGYTVDIAELSIQALWAAMAAGQVDVFGNVYLPNQADLAEQYADKIEFISTHYDDSFNALIVPTWFAEQYDVYTWDDLKRPEIIKLLDRDNNGKGDILGCDVVWVCYEVLEAKLEYAGLSDHYVQLPLTEQMANFEIRRAMQTKQPVIFMSWTPNWIFGAYPVPEVLTTLEDTGRWQPGLTEEELEQVDVTGWIPGIAKTAVTNSFKNDHPEAYRLLEQISLPLQAFNESVNLQVMDGEGSRADLDRHAYAWIENNRETVDGWLKEAGIR